MTVARRTVGQMELPQTTAALAALSTATATAGARACLGVPLALFVTLVLLLLTGPALAGEPPPGSDGVVRFILILGVNRSVDATMPVLRYADDDAIRYAELFQALGGKTFLMTRADDNTRRLAPRLVALAAEPRRSELTRILAAIAAEAAAAHARGVRTVFYFIYAGHGSLNRGEAYLALEDARLTGADIEHGIIDKVRADESHLIVDACYSYFLAYGRGPGGIRHEIHGIAPVEGLARRTDVGLLLSTTSARESHEWEGFQAGVFSHEVRSGLFGAADFDGDGRVSYGEMAAFIDRANAAIPNERFRPDVFARPPGGGAAQLLDLRGGAGHHLRVDGDAQAGRYILDDTRGVRLADFHNAPGHGVSLLLPAEAGPLYLRRTRDDREFEIPDAPDVISLADLSPREPRSSARGAAHDAFSLIFSLPFDQEAFAARPGAAADLTATAADRSPPPGPRPRWRTISGISAAGVAAASVVAATVLTLSARSMADDARRTPPDQITAKAIDDRLETRKNWSRAFYGLGGAAAIAGGFLLLWPAAPVYAAGNADGESAMLEVGGHF